ncbi:glycosyltransferase family 1 protein [Flavobacterium arcticum]|uniref:Glycosyltransferase family 1 protein n=1 Tax=Flavobacterium arcticum TaxID=1784713 RepID=A0A345H987_9FLAO|nr:glycosyltransferase family 4 protein [Flavobacterium arcticum]AXG73147.1 glycosyltransferase family 1 protein [Flavobacterium arcticum]KAF2512939.1 glycosyltransferase family 4 protein [Flavobacterium arcticum]
MKKVLFVANIHKHFRAFHIPYIEYLKSEGYEVHVAANDPDTKIPEADKQYNLPINRNPFSNNNIKATKQLKEIIAIEKYSLIHCHTAMGSVVARLAAKKIRKKGMLKVLYTAHGFHFYKGSPKLYWNIYYPMEKYLAKYTDGLITINEEDYNVVVNNKFKAVNAFKTAGVGINSQKFKGLSLDGGDAIREKNGYDKDTFLIIYIAEFITRKDHKFILEAIPLLKEKINNFKFVFAGRGILKDEMEEMATNQGLTDNVDFLGFRKDIGELIIMSDIGVSVSRQEGLPMNVAEEMFAKKPVVATKIRGHVDLINHGESGFLFNRGDHQEFVNQITDLYKNKELCKTMSENAKIKAEKFELANCLEEMKLIYKKFL